MFTSITSVLNVYVGFGVEVRQPFQCHEGMGFGFNVPTADQFGIQLSFRHVFGAAEEITGQGDGNTSF